MRRLFSILLAISIILAVFLQAGAATDTQHQKYTSQAYDSLSKDQKKNYDSLMNAGDAAWNDQNYNAAVEYYNQAHLACPGDYVSLGSLAEARVKRLNGKNDPEQLEMIQSELTDAQKKLEAEGKSGFQSGFQKYDFLAMTERTQADAYRVEGKNDKAAAIDAQAEADLQNALTASNERPSLPSGPLAAVGGLAIAGIGMSVRKRCLRP